MNTIHDVRECFDLQKFFLARKKTMEIVEKVSKNTFVGMTEQQGHELIEKLMNESQVEKKWHPTKFRIGKNTTKSFKDQSEEGVTLKENDIFFVDIGPVFNNHEGDYGETFVLGDNKDYQDIVNANKVVFEKTRELWQRESLTGVELYEAARKYALSLGYDFNDRMKGHRVGDFPHHLFYKGGMSEIAETPCENLWVLEIHLISKCGKFGSFFEDIIQKN